ncbi:MAG: ferrous iron transport protein B [Saprospiraceae bacterium]|nr:ferrous iron transport protein B [Saprospiraceae bacterium]NNL92618.1 ferrous iron transport protein B [Saprospiraceae bacterium]
MSAIGLVGKPNSGKTSLFNLLTGLNQKVGNYSGVTVEKKHGFYKNNKIVDLPGLNSLWIDTQDEQISQEAILDFANNNDPIIFVANGNQLNGSLVLFSEIADLQTPMCLVINYKDELEKNNISINTDQLSNQLNCKVVMINSVNGDGLELLSAIISEKQFKIPNTFYRSKYDNLTDEGINNSYIKKLNELNKNIDEEVFNIINEDFAQRQLLVNNILNKVVTTPNPKNELVERTNKIDRYLLHPIWGIFIFLLTMLLVFQSVFSFSSIPMDLIDNGFASLASWSMENITIPWLADLVANGIIAGLGGVLIFIPQIVILFVLLGILEHSGYLSRISHLSDRFLQKFGLSGKSIIPLMSSWACAIPAIMSARMIEDPKERMAVIFAAPLMTCSARLPVYTILIAVLVPAEGSGFFNMRGILLLLFYLIGVIATLAVSWFINKRITVNSESLWTLEMPIYRMPNWRNVWLNAYSKTKSFVVEAGKIIFLISIVLWVLASFSPKSDAFIDQQFESFSQAEPSTNISRDAFALEYSYAGYLGKFIEPAIQPLGYDWKIGIALITSFAAREVFVGTLSTIYSVGSEDEQPIIDRLRTEVNMQTGELRYNRATSISLLLFYAFALQCMSTIAIVKKESASWKYAAFQFVFFLALAYIFAFASYRIF